MLLENFTAGWLNPSLAFLCITKLKFSQDNTSTTVESIQQNGQSTLRADQENAADRDEENEDGKYSRLRLPTQKIYETITPRTRVGYKLLYSGRGVGESAIISSYPTNVSGIIVSLNTKHETKISRILFLPIRVSAILRENFLS